MQPFLSMSELLIKNESIFYFDYLYGEKYSFKKESTFKTINFSFGNVTSISDVRWEISEYKIKFILTVFI